MCFSKPVGSQTSRSVGTRGGGEYKDHGDIFKTLVYIFLFFNLIIFFLLLLLTSLLFFLFFNFIPFHFILFILFLFRLPFIFFIATISTQ